jgi:hypothetical protein
LRKEYKREFSKRVKSKLKRWGVLKARGGGGGGVY